MQPHRGFGQLSPMHGFVLVFHAVAFWFSLCYSHKVDNWILFTLSQLASRPSVSSSLRFLYAIIRYNCSINGCLRTSHAPVAQDERSKEMRCIWIVHFLLRKNKFIFTSILLSMRRAGKLWAANGINTSINNTFGIFVVFHLRPSDRRHIPPSRVWCARVQSTNHSLTRQTDTQ